MSVRRSVIVAWFMATSLCKSYAHVRIAQIEEYFKCQKYEMLNFISEWFYFCSWFRSINIFSWQLNSEGDVLAGVNTYRLKRRKCINLLSFEYIIELKKFYIRHCLYLVKPWRIVGLGNGILLFLGWRDEDLFVSVVRKRMWWLFSNDWRRILGKNFVMLRGAKWEPSPSIPILIWLLSPDNDLTSSSLRSVGSSVSLLLLTWFRRISYFRRKKQREVGEINRKKLINPLQLSSLFFLMFSPFSESFSILQSVIILIRTEHSFPIPRCLENEVPNSLWCTSLFLICPL